MRTICQHHIFLLPSFLFLAPLSFHHNATRWQARTAVDGAAAAADIAASRRSNGDAAYCTPQGLLWRTNLCYYHVSLLPGTPHRAWVGHRSCPWHGCIGAIIRQGHHCREEWFNGWGLLYMACVCANQSSHSHVDRARVAAFSPFPTLRDKKCCHVSYFSRRAKKFATQSIDAFFFVFLKFDLEVQTFELKFWNWVAIRKYWNFGWMFWNLIWMFSNLYLKIFKSESNVFKNLTWKFKFRVWSFQNSS